VEHVLSALVAEPGYESAAVFLFDRLGYRAYYERKLGSRNIIVKSSAAAKLGRMRCEASAEKLIPLLDGQAAEIIPVTVRALSKIGTPEALDAVLRRLPELHSRSVVSRKSIESSLLHFGQVGVKALVRYGGGYDSAVAKASVLEVLAMLAAPEALPFAFGNLGHEDPEVRAKALKAVGTAGGDLSSADKDRLLPLLDDDVWFVRLQAAKALGILRHDAAVPLLASRLLDANWQVRNAAATALVQTSDNAIDIFLDTLGTTDRYAKESVCEEIQKTGFVHRLIDNLASPWGQSREKSAEILRIMAQLGYGTPLREYMDRGADERVRHALLPIVRQGVAS